MSEIGFHMPRVPTLCSTSHVWAPEKLYQIGVYSCHDSAATRIQAASKRRRKSRWTSALVGR